MITKGSPSCLSKVDLIINSPAFSYLGCQCCYNSNKTHVQQERRKLCSCLQTLSTKFLGFQSVRGSKPFYFLTLSFPINEPQKHQALYIQGMCFSGLEPLSPYSLVLLIFAYEAAVLDFWQIIEIISCYSHSLLCSQCGRGIV